MIISNPYVGEWVAKRIKGQYNKESSQAIGLLIDGTVKAGVIYENWNQKSIVCHIAVDFMSPEFLASIFDYPFNSLNAHKIVAPVSSGNLKSQKLVKKMGFSIEGVLKDCDPLGDILLYTMKKSDCKYLGNKYGKILRTSRA